MPGRPRKGSRFGGSSQHQKLMLANLVASLIAAEGITTTEAKAKAMRPVAERLITKAKQGGRHNHRQILAQLGDPEITDSKARRRSHTPCVRRGAATPRAASLASRTRAIISVTHH